MVWIRAQLGRQRVFAAATERPLSERGVGRTVASDGRKSLVKVRRGLQWLADASLDVEGIAWTDGNHGY
jgi:hypothetical protein